MWTLSQLCAAMTILVGSETLTQKMSIFWVAFNQVHGIKISFLSRQLLEPNKGLFRVLLPLLGNLLSALTVAALTANMPTARD